MDCIKQPNRNTNVPFLHSDKVLWGSVFSSVKLVVYQVPNPKVPHHYTKNGTFVFWFGGFTQPKRRAGGGAKKHAKNLPRF
jgi:hypothetical protein